MKEIMIYLNEDLLVKSKRKTLLLLFILLNKGNLNAVLFTKLYLINSKKKNFFSIILSWVFKNYLIKNYGIELSKNVIIGRNFRYGHANGIIIGEGVVIEDNVVIYQQVTIGLSSINNKGNLKDYPHIKSNSVIYAGAKIIGNITVEKNTIIGANAVLLKKTVENGVYVGVPAVKIGDKS